jgi:hypothetical protein
VGVLWTPGYWGYNGSVYAFNEGYWGPTVGFYGGIDYGFGYGGHGYYGGEWAGSSFRYNTAVTRVDTTVIHNTYVNKTVVSSSNASRSSFNGPGGVKATATAQEQAAMKAEHIPPTTAQHSREQAASKNPDLLASTNHGQPKTEAIKALDASNGQKPATSEKQSAAKTKVSSQPATKATQTHDAAVKSVQSKGTHPVQTHRPSQTLSRKTVPARAPVQPAAKKKPAKGPPGSAQ